MIDYTHDGQPLETESTASNPLSDSYSNLMAHVNDVLGKRGLNTGQAIKAEDLNNDAFSEADRDGTHRDTHRVLGNLTSGSPFDGTAHSGSLSDGTGDGTPEDTRHYHVAPRHARESILQQGLTPMSMPNRLWEESHDDKVHLWHSDGDALDWVDWTRQQRGEDGDPWDIWEVNSSGLPLEPDEYLPTSAVTHEGTIPSERLRLANDDYLGIDDRVSKSARTPEDSPYRDGTKLATYYHVAPQAERNQIRMFGLKPQTFPEVYLWNNPEIAQTYQQRMNSFEPHDLWQVHPQGVTPVEDRGSMTTAQPVAAPHLTLTGSVHESLMMKDLDPDTRSMATALHMAGLRRDSPFFPWVMKRIKEGEIRPHRSYDPYRIDYRDALIGGDRWNIDYARERMGRYFTILSDFQLANRKEGMGDLEDFLPHLRKLHRERRQAGNPLNLNGMNVAGVINAISEAQRLRAANYGKTVHTLPNNWTIRKLQNGEEARWEGDQMANCIGDYASDIDSKEAHIYSLRDEKNRPKVSVEFSEDPYKTKHPVSVEQIFAKANSELSGPQNTMIKHWFDNMRHRPTARYGDPIATLQQLLHPEPQVNDYGASLNSSSAHWPALWPEIVKQDPQTLNRVLQWAKDNRQIATLGHHVQKVHNNLDQSFEEMRGWPASEDWTPQQAMQNVGQSPAGQNITYLQQQLAPYWDSYYDQYRDSPDQSAPNRAPQLRFAKKAKPHPIHTNPAGEPCNCPWSKSAGLLHEALAADPQWWQTVGPLYHSTSPENAEAIERDGLRPWDETGNTRFDYNQDGEWNFHEPRPGHIYLHSTPWKLEDKHVLYKVDPSHLDPTKINADEDWPVDFTGFDPEATKAWDGMYGQGEGTLGEMAERYGLGDNPDHTQRSYNDKRSIAYRGSIPPNALQRVAAFPFDLLTCVHCHSHNLSEPKQVGGHGWLQRCLDCGRSRKLPADHPLVQSMGEQTPYPEALEMVGPERPWNVIAQSHVQADWQGVTAAGTPDPHLAADDAEDPVERWVSQGQYYPYRELPPEAQRAIAHYMAFDGDAWEQGDDPLEANVSRFIEAHGDQKFGYHPGVPMQEVRQAIMSKNRDITNEHPSWDAYHQWYVGKGDTPTHAEQWPVILDRDYGEILQDGWHRLHSYERSGFPTVPAVWYPRPHDKVGSTTNKLTDPHGQRFHFNHFTGKKCYCAWGYGKEQADHRDEMRRRFGSQNVRRLKNQDPRYLRSEEGQGLLDWLHRRISGTGLDEPLVEHGAGQNPGIEPLVPWFADQLRKGYLHFKARPDDADPESYNWRSQTPRPWINWTPGEPPEFTHNQWSMGNWSVPTDYQLRLASDWMNAGNHPMRQGVNVMDLAPHELIHKGQEFAKAMEEKRLRDEYLHQLVDDVHKVHRFDNDWSVAKIYDRDQAELESAVMGHCIGDSSQPYAEAIDNGEIEAYSLRDPEGWPHATWHFNPNGSLANLQGRSGGVKPEYRQLISDWHEHAGRPDYVEGEHDLNPEEEEEQYDAEYRIPAATNPEEYYDHWHPDGDRYRYAYDDPYANIGEDTEVYADEPDHDSIAYEYLNNADDDDRRKVNETAASQTYNGHVDNLHEHLLDYVDEDDEDHQEAMRQWNDYMTRCTDANGRFVPPMYARHPVTQQYGYWPWQDTHQPPLIRQVPENHVDHDPDDPWTYNASWNLGETLNTSSVNSEVRVPDVSSEHTSMVKTASTCMTCGEEKDNPFSARLCRACTTATSHLPQSLRRRCSQGHPMVKDLRGARYCPLCGINQWSQNRPGPIDQQEMQGRYQRQLARFQQFYPDPGVDHHGLTLRRLAENMIADGTPSWVATQYLDRMAPQWQATVQNPEGPVA